MIGFDPAWRSAICQLADDEPLIEAVYVFGSRAKNQARYESDLDLGFVIAGNDPDESLGNWFFEHQKWRVRLEQSIPVRIDMQCVLPDDKIVTPAIMEHGIRIYPAAGHPHFHCTDPL